MIAEQNHGAHSAQVEMQLIVNGESISITHMGPDFLIVSLRRTPARRGHHRFASGPERASLDRAPARWPSSGPETRPDFQIKFDIGLTFTL